MQTQQANWVQYVTGIFAFLLVAGLFAGWYAPDVNVTTEEVVVEQSSCDLTALDEKVDNIQTTINEDDDFKDLAISLATEEFEKSSYKEIYRFIDDMDEKTDIDKVIIKDSEVTSFNVDDKDATVIQELKVYYENYEGEEVKVYLIVETIIEDGDVEEQSFEFK